MTEKKKPRSPWADKPYKIGKGKPPKETQFKPGQRPPKGSGRPKGSRNVTDLEKLLEEKVQVGTDSLGRPIRRRLGNVINRQLVKKAAEGDLAAIKLVKMFELALAAQKRKYGPSAEDALAEQAEEAARAEASAKLVTSATAMMDTLTALKKLGVITWTAEGIQIEQWLQKEAALLVSSPRSDHLA